MIVSELIEDLQRFPQGARVHSLTVGMVVDLSPMENEDGETLFEVDCPDARLPPELRAAVFGRRPTPPVVAK